MDLLDPRDKHPASLPQQRYLERLLQMTVLRLCNPGPELSKFGEPVSFRDPLVVEGFELRSRGCESGSAFYDQSCLLSSAEAGVIIVIVGLGLLQEIGMF
jgi:hypothetical protein